MKQQIETLGRLASLRSHRVRQMLGRVQYQQNLCQRYRNNITGLSRLCGFSVPMSTPLQRDNQQRYKATLYKMVELQRRELAVAEQALERIQRELLQAMRSEKVVEHVIEGKLQQWQQLLAQQEQKIQDGLAAQAHWRATH
ncbi:MULTISPECIES: flagellar FliJ family protein [Stutzerimonas stutzeri group]|jgi:flagellar export protein FliJ|uniref:Flagellar FliJ protein n=2 Tax=Stutzerimonas stutzeri group TaxID=136846 RepID=A0AA47E255_9GAMM|nr:MULTISPECIES: flagellar FliJ family protein [Stutzerimonas stutzeri group]MBW8337327.1 flagellar FliJ family protein [Pseudomonas sp.]MCJ0876843.1 flagellar FliJ family protein [Pseudomonas sp. JI-2]NMY64572.1 flagellar export protein FliJ [Pseudomonas sp. WS 5018]AEA82101.1 flagellar export protein FliJ [Stutzerimonas stutzeri DSM 4166]AKN25111.1 lateral flagellar export/assembly protein [Stutzerimonas stutzeri]